MVNYGVVDLSNLFYRARFGASRSDPETMAAMALLIIFRSLRKMHRDLKLDHMVFAADSGSWRYQVYPDYKARRRLVRVRASAAEQRENQIFADTLQALIGYLAGETRCTVLQAPDIEGDDFIASWITHHPADRHIIISGDSDFVQLLDTNVMIFDAINQRLIDVDHIVDSEHRSLAFGVDPKNGKIKVGSPDATFTPEPEWWKKALFVKLIRGDVSDSIFSAFPRVRYDGKKVAIAAAWQDRKAQGYDWNNFMFQTWEKLVGTDPDGNKLTENVRVIDAFQVNESLIDLSKQPAWVVYKMNETIERAIARDLPKQVGMSFLRFCRKHDLPTLAKEANDHVLYLNSHYPRP